MTPTTADAQAGTPAGSVEVHRTADGDLHTALILVDGQVIMTIQGQGQSARIDRVVELAVREVAADRVVVDVERSHGTHSGAA